MRLSCLGIEESRGMSGEREQDFVEHSCGGGVPPPWLVLVEGGEGRCKKSRRTLSSSKRHMRLRLELDADAISVGGVRGDRGEAAW